MQAEVEAKNKAQVEQVHAKATGLGAGPPNENLGQEVAEAEAETAAQMPAKQFTIAQGDEAQAEAGAQSQMATEEIEHFRQEAAEANPCNKPKLLQNLEQDQAEAREHMREAAIGNASAAQDNMAASQTCLFQHEGAESQDHFEVVHAQTEATTQLIAEAEQADHTSEHGQTNPASGTIES